MAKGADWTKAKALYEVGKSLRDISKETGIDNSNISKRAKKEGWSREELPRLVSDAVRVQEEITALSLPQQEIVTAEVKKILEAKDFYATHARKVAKTALSALDNDKTPANAKTTMEVLHKGLVVEGVVPYYPNAAVINNTNAQQNNAVELTAFQNRPAIKKDDC